MSGLKATKCVSEPCPPASSYGNLKCCSMYNNLNTSMHSFRLETRIRTTDVIKTRMHPAQSPDLMTGCIGI